MGVGSAFARGPLADEDFGAVAIGLVVVLCFFKALLGADVVVIVLDIGLHVFQRHGGDELQVWVLRLDGFVELRVAIFVGVRAIEGVFVADFNIGELERSRVPVLRADGAPLGVGPAGDVFNFVESVLYVGLEVVAGLHEVLHEGEAGVNSENRLHLEVFAPPEELKQTEAVGGLITPGAEVSGPVDQRADGFLPVETL